MVAWPDHKCVILDQDLETEDICPKSPSTNSLNRCKLLDWCTNDDIVAEGCWQSQEPKAMVNGVLLEPNAIQVFIDVVHKRGTFLWRSTLDMAYIEDSLMKSIAWLADRVVLEKTTDATSQNSPLLNSEAIDQATNLKSAGVNAKFVATGSKDPIQKYPTTATNSPFQSSPPKSPKYPIKNPKPLYSQSPLWRSQGNSVPEGVKENKKCNLMDITGKNRIIAVGRWASNDPDQTVHFAKLGPNAVKVWIDVVKVNDATVWRSTTEIKCMGDALGTTIARLEDKVILC